MRGLVFLQSDLKKSLNLSFNVLQKLFQIFIFILGLVVFYCACSLSDLLYFLQLLFFRCSSSNRRSESGLSSGVTRERTKFSVGSGNLGEEVTVLCLTQMLYSLIVDRKNWQVMAGLVRGIHFSWQGEVYSLPTT